jgi:hypothetical protein
MGGAHRHLASPKTFQLVIIGFVPFTSSDTRLQQPLYQSFLSKNIPEPAM